ncbi:MAG: glycosyltransferase family 2 protein [Candidatus Bathyarchaeia archaeon]|nr:glycosyltransferase family 2 protein [Candidatus Bathyarchaeota archaeon]
MTLPIVSILWLNYNSSNFIEIILESLTAIANLDYPKDQYELIVVDNGSTDNSYGVIKNFLEKQTGLNKKIIRLSRNLGFTGGNNVAYKVINRNSEYIVLLNNDAVPTPESLKMMVDFLHTHPSVGSLQGILVMYDNPLEVEDAGFFMDELLLAHSFLVKSPPFILRKPVFVTYTCGAYNMYRILALKKVGCINKLFSDIMFAYFDDSVLGLKLWNIGYKSAVIPEVTGRHVLNLSFGKTSPNKVYYSIRGWTVLNEITNSRYKKLIRALIPTLSTRVALTNIGREFLDIGNVTLNHIRAGIRGYVDGIRLSRIFKEKINIYNAPIIKISNPQYIVKLLLKRASVSRTISRYILNIFDK